MTEPCTTCGDGGGGVTLEQVEALIAEATDEEFVIWAGADFMPATGRVFPGKPLVDVLGALTGIWEGYNFTGLEYQPGVDQTACRPLFYPAEWASLTINAVMLASGFGTGVTRWYRSGDDATAVDITVAAFYVGPLFENVGGASATPFGKKMLQMPITREASVDVFGQGAAVLAFYGTEGT